MSQFYQSKRTKNLYDPGSKIPFRLSRSKLEAFLNCPRCFYMDRRLGVAQPPGFPFNLNSAVDHLLKKEFDLHRAANTQHPLQAHYGLEVKPFAHPMLDIWRENFKGVEFFHKATNVIFCGAVDDLWIDANEEIIVVDYKATSKDSEVGIDAEWQSGYRNQMEIYQWLFRQNGFTVSEVGYFVYCNGLRDREAFDGKLEFEVKVIPYKGNTDWVEPALIKAVDCLKGELPEPGKNCDYCAYRLAASTIEQKPIIPDDASVKTIKKKPVKANKTDASAPALF